MANWWDGDKVADGDSWWLADPDVNAENPAPAAPAEKRGFGGKLARQIGLSARAPLDALVGTVGIFSNPLVAAYNLATGAHKDESRRIPFANEALERVLPNWVPRPETGIEKFSNAAAGAGYGSGAVSGAANLAAKAAPGITEALLPLTSNVGAQISAATTGAGASDLAREAGLPLSAQIGLGVAAAPLGSRAWDKGVQIGSRVAVSADRIRQAASNIANRAGFDYTGLSAGMRQELDDIVGNALRNNAPLSAEQVKRWANLKAAGVEQPTRGMVTRDPSDWAQETRYQTVTGVGEPIRDRYIAADQAIPQAIRKVVGGPDVTPPQAGREAVGGLKSVADQLKEASNKAYNAAWKNPALKEGVPVNGLRNWLMTTKPLWGVHKEYEAALAQLDDLAGGMPKMTQGNYELLRQKINSLRRSNGDNARVVGDINSQLDETVLGAGKGGVFDDARNAYTLYKATTADQGIVDDLLAKTSRTDRKIPYEDVFRKTVISGDIDGLKQVKNTLLMGSRVGVGVQPQAWQALQKRAVDHLAETLLPSEGRPVRAATFLNRMNDMREKLPILFGEDQVRQLGAIEDAVKSSMTDVPRSVTRTGFDLYNALMKTLQFPGVRQINTLAGGLPGAALAAGAGSLRDVQQARQVQGLLAPFQAAPAQTRLPYGPALTQGLLGALLADESTR